MVIVYQYLAYWFTSVFSEAVRNIKDLRLSDDAPFKVYNNLLLYEPIIVIYLRCTT